MIATTVQNRSQRSLEQEGAKPRLRARPARKPRRGWRPQAEFLEGRELLNSVVSVATEMAQASEIGPTPGIFGFTRTGDLSSPLQANFSLGGTAQLGVDYQLMDKTADFDAGSNTAYVTVLPINVARQEANETLTLTLVPGAGYTVGTAASATATIADSYVAGLPGVFNLPNPSLPVGFSPDPSLPVRMTYLQATTGGGSLQIVFGLVDTGAEQPYVEIYLDTDQNPLTGDQRMGHVGGQEYRVDVPIIEGCDIGSPEYAVNYYYLCPLPSTPGQTQLSLPPSNPYLGLGPDQPSATGGVTYLGSAQSLGGFYSLTIPLADLVSTPGNPAPAAVDLFAFTHGDSDGSQASSEGDRVPKFGAIDTSTGNVVVRDPVGTRIATVSNPVSQSSGPYQITGATFASIVDQFFTSLNFSQPIGSDGTLVGELDLDSDRSLNTGDIPMRGAIQDGTGVPSFGGDESLWFRFGGIEGAMVGLEHDQSYDPFDDPDAVFGGQDNDGRWVYSGNTLTLVSSISTFDPFQITFKDPLTEASTRLSTYPNQGDMYARCTITDELGTVTYDSLPRGLGSGVVDTATGQVVAPLTLDQNQKQWVAPPSPTGILAAPDFLEVDAEVVEGNLVVKGVLEQLPSEDIGTEYAIYLDTSPSGGFVPDYEVTITTEEGYTAFVRSATLISPDGSSSSHDTWVNVDAHDVDDFDSSGQPVHGSFTVTIPLNELKNVGPKLDLYVASIDTVADPGFVYDVAPHDANGNISPPVEIDTGNGPTAVTPASATPSPVTGTTTTLSVLGADDGGEANLTYTWATTTLPAGASAPTFSVNGTNSAKQSVATFSNAGTYGFTVTIADARGFTTTSSVNVVVNQSLTSIAVSPASVTVNVGGTQQFTATAKDQFGSALATQPSFTWAATTGTITASGLFTAPSTSATGTGTVTAASGSLFAKASVTVNSAPTVVTPASATPSTVTGTTTTLSLLGADDGGEANLTYTWAATTLPAGAAAPPPFSVNGTNAAKQTVVTFSNAGTYGFTVTIADAGGLTTTSRVNVVVNQSLTSIAVSPASVTVNVGGTQQLTATAKDQFGNALATQPSFTWAATAGTITTGGLFTAPTTTGSVTVTATSGSRQSSANVNVTTPLTPPAAPSFTATPVSATQINLAWTPVTGATGYLVDEWINGAWAQVGSLSSGSTSYVVGGLSPNTTYYFDMAAYNASGTTWANYQSATTQNTALPAAPSFAATPVSATQINLAWTGVAGATGYLVDELINGAWKQIGSLGSGSTSFVVGGLSPNTTYYFDMAAYNASGTTWANYQSATTYVGSTGPSPAPNAVTSPNWSGYVAATSISQPKANSVTAVSGSWIVPTVTGPSTGSYYSSVWVGIDGWGNSTVEQLGTEEDLVNGSPVYRAWWEMYSSGNGQPEQVITSINVMPGDSITASVQYITSGAHAGQFYQSIVDNSRANDAFSIYASSSQYQSPLAQLSCAEWIVEAPTVGGSYATVPNFGSVTFTNATAVINGVSGPINAASWQSQALNLGSNGVTYDTTSVLTNSGTSFVVTYNPSAGAAVRAGSNAAAVGTALRSGKTIAGPVIRGTAWSGASVVSGFRTPAHQHKRPTQGFVIEPLWN